MLWYLLRLCFLLELLFLLCYDVVVCQYFLCSFYNVSTWKVVFLSAMRELAVLLFIHACVSIFCCCSSTTFFSFSFLEVEECCGLIRSLRSKHNTTLRSSFLRPSCCVVVIPRNLRSLSLPSPVFVSRDPSWPSPRSRTSILSLGHSWSLETNTYEGRLRNRRFRTKRSFGLASPSVLFS